MLNDVECVGRQKQVKYGGGECWLLFSLQYFCLSLCRKTYKTIIVSVALYACEILVPHIRGNTQIVGCLRTGDNIWTQEQWSNSRLVKNCKNVNLHNIYFLQNIRMIKSKRIRTCSMNGKEVKCKYNFCVKSWRDHLYDLHIYGIILKIDLK